TLRIGLGLVGGRIRRAGRCLTGAAEEAHGQRNDASDERDLNDNGEDTAKATKATAQEQAQKTAEREAAEKRAAKSIHEAAARLGRLNAGSCGGGLLVRRHGALDRRRRIGRGLSCGRRLEGI